MADPTHAESEPWMDKIIAALPGIGPQRAELLARLKIFSIRDLLCHRPRRYEDRRALVRIADLEPDQAATVQGTILACGVKHARQRTKSVFEFILSDGSARLHCRWWNLPFMERYFKTGDTLFVHGRVRSLRPRTMDHPETETVEEGEEALHLRRIVPIYPLTEGIHQRALRRWVWALLLELKDHLRDPLRPLVSASMPGLETAFRWIHFPDELEQIEQARQRLAMNEWIELQKAILIRRARLESRAKGRVCEGDNRLIRPFLKALGFRLTEQQAAVLKDVRRDLRSGIPMRRLLQGDVGSGKTVVAACGMLMAIEAGYNAALMAPTEILAEQHAQLFRKWFEPLAIQVALHTSSHRHNATGQEEKTSLPIASIGTHALLEEAVGLAKLGFVVIDEQHRFGVAQREALVRKGLCPHLLVMTATPIPRTLGLALYGDLDASVIRQRPPGRGKIRTFLRKQSELERVWTFLQERLKAGERAYVVYPLVEESDEKSLKAVTRDADALAARLAPFKVGVMHGRLAPALKAATMDDFRAGRISVLASTSVIEVGVDVAEATVMVIQDADRFGLAQLHQLRGRVGRGSRESFCIVATQSNDPEVLNRLKVLEKTEDGFELAEADLRLRGPGEFLGRAQSGMPSFRFARLELDLDLARVARQRVIEARAQILAEAGMDLGRTGATR